MSITNIRSEKQIISFFFQIITPIGTVIDVSLHGWSNTMNIDIYMFAKDFGNVDGLCGNFDGNKSNDLLHRDKVTISFDDNRSFRFADSWRYTKAIRRY